MNKMQNNRVLMATGLMAGWNAARLARGEEPLVWPRQTAHGSLANYISGADPKNYQPANITFDLLPAVSPEERKRLKRDRKARRALQCSHGLEALERFLEANELLAA